MQPALPPPLVCLPRSRQWNEEPIPYCHKCSQLMQAWGEPQSRICPAPARREKLCREPGSAGDRFLRPVLLLISWEERGRWQRAGPPRWVFPFMCLLPVWLPGAPCPLPVQGLQQCLAPISPMVWREACHIPLRES